MVFAEGKKISVTDLGSTNGTYLDEEELPPNRAADLYIGSRIVFGERHRTSCLTNPMLCVLCILRCAEVPLVSGQNMHEL